MLRTLSRISAVAVARAVTGGAAVDGGGVLAPVPVFCRTPTLACVPPRAAIRIAPLRTAFPPMSEASANFASTLAAVAFGSLLTLWLVGGAKKDGTAAEATRAAEAAADAAAAELAAAEPPAAAPSGKKKKKKKKKAKADKAAAPPRAAPAPTAAEEGTDTDSDATPKQVTSKKKKKKKSKGGAAVAAGGDKKQNGSDKKPNDGGGAAAEAKALPPQKAVAPRQPSAFAQEEEWVSVKAAPKRNKKPAARKKKAAAAGGSGTVSVAIDAKKVGVVIGPKGATMKAIEEAAGCQVEVNAPDKDAPVGSGARQATVILSDGSPEQLAKARTAVLELAAKGYAALLQKDATFGESYVEVHPRHLSELVGTGGKTIQAIQKGCNVTLTIPPTSWRPDAPASIVGGAAPTCRVGVAGSKADAARAREVVRALVTYHHHDLTHPGQVHKTVYVPRERFGTVVGPRGSELRHIRGNYKVEVHLPRDDDEDDEGVLVVGRPADVDRATAHIEKLLAREAERRDSRYQDEAY